MADLLVRLYSLPEEPVCEGFSLRRCMAHESDTVRNWIRDVFSEAWSAEVVPALSRTPSTIIIAVDRKTQKPAGFCVWDCTALGFLGPIGVAPEYRNMGIGRAVTLGVLHRMREQGYGYSIIGGVGPAEFFGSVCEATEIADSTPGVYPETLK